MKITSVSNHFFIVSTDAHNYKIIGMLKTIKIPTIAPTFEFDVVLTVHRR